MAQASAAYPVDFAVDYPDRDLDRVSTLLRLFFVIPIGIILAAAAPATINTGSGWAFGVGATGVVVFAPMLMILFRQKYPRPWFDWNLYVAKFSYRVQAYLLLLRDEYPATDDEQTVHVEIPYPDVPRELNRWLPLVKWLLAMPHYVVLVILGIGLVVAVIIAWFSILFTGRYPRGLFDYVVGVQRWGIRVQAYAFLLTTDRYPPFRLAA